MPSIDSLSLTERENCWALTGARREIVVLLAEVPPRYQITEFGVC